MQLNRVEVAGHIAKKPEVRFLPSGLPVANVRLGQTYRFQDSSRHWKEHTNWHNLSFYGDLSKLAVTFEKGENIFVEGTIEQREFTPKDGAKRVVSEIVVKHCHVIAPARGVVASAAAAATSPTPNGESIQDLETAASHDDDWPIR